jgi:hypothetical protein
MHRGEAAKERGCMERSGVNARLGGLQSPAAVVRTARLNFDQAIVR